METDTGGEGDRSPERMPCVERVVDAPQQDVWEVLADGWLYPVWVVGAARIRDVEASWPQQGARLHHSFGLWPALVHDTTEVLEVEPGSRLRLRARGWPLGEAQVELLLTAAGPERTHVRVYEKAVSGPGRLIPSIVETPLVRWRNTEALRRLAMLAEGRAARPVSLQTDPAPEASTTTRNPA